MAHLDPKPQPYTFDLGHLLCNDPNPLPSLSSNKEATLQSVARDTAQALINQLLSTCPITKAPDDGSLQLSLPAPSTPLPREKPIPKEKEQTRWEKFAAKKGIKNKRREGKTEFDEVSGEWKPKYGYKGKKGEGVQEDWLVEVEDEGKRERREKAAASGGDVGRRDRKIKARKAR